MPVEGQGYIDATYFSVMTISTVGYGDITPQTAAGKIFTICCVLVGLGVFVTTASALADVLLSKPQVEGMLVLAGGIVRHDRKGAAFSKELAQPASTSLIYPPITNVLTTDTLDRS